MNEHNGDEDVFHANSTENHTEEEESKREQEEISDALWLLQMGWQNENNAPELLRFEADSVEKVHSVLKKQQQKIDDISDNLNSQTGKKSVVNCP
ncbi:hypothetical protein RFI_01072 [Reticulomyxa filosa]|uniref:Uncharacterized protein n=1 Tax=Reticulomyxa filosa TaxID=46433 RepID=X6PBV9_RETFI|nr:hypothetical protein RFI_01072 [Reticulomyxa filosa]|eukprot:ETO35990.1 hypothetical protein RFI_01072 [Reticulomyxa filosa]